MVKERIVIDPAKIHLPIKVRPQDQERIAAYLAQGKNCAESAALTIIEGADGLLPSERMVYRYRGLLDDVGLHLFRFILPSIALLDAIEYIKTGISTPPFDRLPKKLHQILIDQYTLMTDLAELEGPWVRESKKALEEYESDKALYLAAWHSNQPKLARLLIEMKNPLGFVDNYVTNIKFKSTVDVPGNSTTVQALERGRKRFHRLYKACIQSD